MVVAKQKNEWYEDGEEDKGLQMRVNVQRTATTKKAARARSSIRRARANAVASSRTVSEIAIDSLRMIRFHWMIGGAR